MRKILFLSFLIISLTNCNNSNEKKDSLRKREPFSFRKPASLDFLESSENNNFRTAQGNIPHYVCADNCENGYAEFEGSCPTCGKSLIHNQAWHNQEQVGPKANAAPIEQINTTTQQTVSIPAGKDGIVHHYICTSGCKNGHAENPGNCSECKKTLAHNQAWHNQPQAKQSNSTNQTQTPTSVNIPAGSDGIVHHYICTTGCKGGFSENTGSCPICKKTFAHNQAWHNQPKTTSTSTNDQLEPWLRADPALKDNTTEKKNETVNVPAGSDGIVHHYICSKNCKDGFAETSGNCPSCNTQLSHNQAWHNK